MLIDHNVHFSNPLNVSIGYKYRLVRDQIFHKARHIAIDTFK